MEDDKIKDLFRDFKPQLSSSSQFMAEMQKNLEAVEIVRRYNRSVRRRNKMAVVIAAVCGFVMGTVMTMLLPWLDSRLTSMSLSLHGITLDASILMWILTVGVSMIFAYNAYEIAMAKLPKKEVERHL